MKKRKPLTSSFYIALLFLVAIMGCGLTLIGVGARETWGAVRSQQWRTVSATILTSEVASQVDSDGDTSYKPEITYEYLPDHPDFVGQMLTADRIKFGQISDSRSSIARDVVHRYPVGETVTVYLNPADPTDAVLEPGLTWSLLFFPILGSVFAGVGCMMLYSVIYMFRSR